MVLHDAFYIFNFNKNTTTTVTFQSIFARYAMDHCENERKKPGAARPYSKPPSSMTIDVQFLMYIFRRIRIGGKIKTRKNHAFELE